MELQLGLALPSPPLIPMEMLNFNNYRWPLLNYSSSSSSSTAGGDSNPPCCDEAPLLFVDRRIVPKTLPLFHWSNRPDDEDDPSKELDDNSSSSIFKNDGEGLVGWQPVKIWRKKQGQEIHDGVADNNRAAAAAAVDNGRGGRASKSSYVKVKMEGVAIGRKIDVSVHHSFESLTSTVMRMFGLRDEYRDSFKLTYQDREGDWLLAEDVPWRTFVRSLKCLKLIRCRG